MLSRRTGSNTDSKIIHVHEVDLAFVKVFDGITEAYANPKSESKGSNDKKSSEKKSSKQESGTDLVFGGGGGVGEKVFAADWKGARDFRKENKKTEERFYGLIFPKGFIAHFGMDISKKSNFTDSVKKDSKDDTSIREPNEQEFSKHKMEAMNGDPEVKIGLDKMFFVRVEKSTTDGQVDIHFGWRGMNVDGEESSHPKFFRSYVLGVVEFTKNGQIIRYQRLK